MFCMTVMRFFCFIIQNFPPRQFRLQSVYMLTIEQWQIMTYLLVSVWYVLCNPLTLSLVLVLSIMLLSPIHHCRMPQVNTALMAMSYGILWAEQASRKCYLFRYLWDIMKKSKTNIKICLQTLHVSAKWKAKMKR